MTKDDKIQGKHTSDKKKTPSSELNEQPKTWWERLSHIEIKKAVKALEIEKGTRPSLLEVMHTKEWQMAMHRRMTMKATEKLIQEEKEKEKSDEPGFKR